MLGDMEYFRGAKRASELHSQLVGLTCGGLRAVAFKNARVAASDCAGELEAALGCTMCGKGTYGLGVGYPVLGWKGV